jgi:nucleoredoxin
MELLKSCSLRDHKGSVSSDVLQNKVVGIYFSAHWCPPCRKFTPQLSKVYTQLKNKDESAFEVVFVSFDRTEQQFTEYFAQMPWLAVEFGESARVRLSDEYRVSGIPTLVILDKDGNILTRSGVAGVGSSGADGFPWTNASDSSCTLS